MAGADTSGWNERWRTECEGLVDCPPGKVVQCGTRERAA